MQVDFNEDLNGYILTFKSGRVAQTQYEVETNKLHADYGERFLERYTEFDDDLSEDENKQVEEFIESKNKRNSL